MSADATGTRSGNPRYIAPRRIAGWGLLSFALHTLILTALLVFVPGGLEPQPARSWWVTTFEPRDRTFECEPESEADCEIEEVTEQDVVFEAPVIAETPVIKDEEISDHVRTDHDLPYEDCIGAGRGISVGPFEGPAANAAMGMGGGAGGAFSGRGGCRDLGCGGGGRKAMHPAEEKVHRARRCFRTEGYDRIRDNPFRRAKDEHTSTFSIDVDTASYANVRRYLTLNRRLPPKDAVRIEELLNYFPYAYAPPSSRAATPFRVHAHVATCPWNPRHRLARIAIKGKVIDEAKRAPANLVFLVDVSGSMEPRNKLPLLKDSLMSLVRRLRDRDRVAIVVYAGAAGMVLPSTPGTEKERILAALDDLSAGGSTNGGAGIQLAYRLATKHFIEGGINRVILATDGDFNVGVTGRGDLTRLIEQKAKTGVYLSILGFGMGNYKDDRMEELSNKGNGNYAYIDTPREARKVLGRQMSGTLVTIAKDVKIQVFFNPARVAGFRLIGYENRLLAKQDFNDDKKDAGDIGAGHTVTALYEIVPHGVALKTPGVDPNPFVRSPRAPRRRAGSKALFRLRMRYKRPEGTRSTLLERDVFDQGRSFAQADPEFRWAAAVAAFGQLLRDSEHKGRATWDSVLKMARAATGADPHGDRGEFLDLVTRARRLALEERG